MWLEKIARMFCRSHRRWRLYHESGVMECFITDGEGMSAEIRFEYRGEEYHCFVHATRDDAEREASEKLAQLTLVGWTDHPGQRQATMSCER